MKGNMPTKEMALLGLAIIAAAAIMAVVQQGTDQIVASSLEKLL